MKLDSRVAQQHHQQQQPNGASRSPYLWEYRTAQMDRDSDLSQYGAEGWELVSVLSVDGTDTAVFFFKRRRA